MKRQPVVTCIFGRRGSGKTTRAKAVAAEETKVLAFDPMGDYRGPGWRAAQDRAGLVRLAAQGVREGRYRLAYTPNMRAPGVDLAAEAAWLADLAFRVQANYPREDKEPLLLLVDEANLAYPVSRAHAPVGAAMSAAILQGRHAGIGALFVTQRPALVGMNARSQAAEIFCYALDWPDDLDVIGKLHPDARRLLRVAPQFSCVRIKDGAAALFATSKNGRLTPAKPMMRAAS